MPVTHSDGDDTDLTEVVHLDRERLLEALAGRFPDAPRGGTDHDIRGGRAAALERLCRIDPAAYAVTRNLVGGKVTGLSPWIRHGVLSLAEVRDQALAVAESPTVAEKFVSELGWRDYWQRVQGALGGRIMESLERPAAIPRKASESHLPPEVERAATGLACVDAFLVRLVTTGGLHNHERMWLAAWMVHTAGIDWRVGADFFLTHLLDGDPASNHLSWQWVAGTFSAKPYLARRRTIEGCTDGVHCRACPVATACPFDGDDEQVSARSFQGMNDRPPLRIPPATPWRPPSRPAERPLVWLTLDSASVIGPALVRAPRAPAVFVIDTDWLSRERPSIGRLAFLFECLADVEGVRVVVGNPAEVLPRLARRLDCDGVSTADTTCPRVRDRALSISRSLPLECHPWPRFVDDSRIRDLGRFSRYWQAVRASALVPTVARDDARPS